MTRLFLIEGLPGSGKSFLINELRKKYPVVYEFHTRRKITKQFGAFYRKKRIILKNKKVEKLEKQLENTILSSRFLDKSKSFEKIKLNLLKERIKDCLALKEDIVMKDGLLASLVDRNSDAFLKELSSALKKVDTIFFLRLSDKELRKRQLRRIMERKGFYNDETNKRRNKIFLSQFKKVARGHKVIYLNAASSPDKTAQELIKKIR